MTTEFQVLRAPDVFVENDVLRIDAAGRPGDLHVAGAAWLLLGEPPREAHRRSLNHAGSLVTTKLAGYALWLLAGHTAWQPDSRVPRYRRLWGSLGRGGLAKPTGRDLGEGLIEGTEGIRFFGGVQLHPGSLDAVIAILEDEPASHLVALKPSDEDVATTLVQTGWAKSGDRPNAEVLTSVCGADGVVLWPVGAFDDREAGCVALARSEVLDLFVE